MKYSLIFTIGVLIFFFTFTASAGENDNPLTLQSPAGGEQIVAGKVYDIHYFAPKVENICIETSADGGATWTEIRRSDKVDAQLGFYRWKVPDTASDNCLVRITEIYGSGTAVTSAPFSIIKQTNLKIEKKVEKFDEGMYPEAGGSD